MFRFLIYEELNDIDMGLEGENKVNNMLNVLTKRELKDHHSKIYRDVYVEYEDKVYQIDSVFVFDQGIFVNEIKTIAGKVYGDTYHESWMSFIAGHRTDFFNPLYQNKAHIAALKHLLGDKYDYHSLIIFVNNNKPQDLPDEVINYRNLKDLMLHYKAEHPLSEEDIEHIRSVLEENKTHKIELRRKHRAMIKAMSKT